MRELLWGIVIASPFIALAQSYLLSPASAEHFASALVLTTSNKIADVVVPLINGQRLNHHHRLSDSWSPILSPPAQTPAPGG